MKKTLLTTAILLALHSGSAAAESRGEVYPEQDWGTAIGSVFGVIVGGPAGLIIGGAAGSLLGHSAGMERELKACRDTEADPAVTPVAPVVPLRQPEPAPEQSADALLAEAFGQGFGASVLFRTDRDELEPFYRRELEQLAQLLTRLPGIQAEITGQADARGTDAHNLRLAERRVQHVRALLQQNGFSRQAIHERVLGEQGARAVEADPHGLMFDRRVVIRFSLNTQQGD